MSQLLSTIRLKHLVSLLNDEEFDSMSSKLRQIFGREYVIQMVCSPINVQVIDVESIEKMSAAVLSIIHSRDPNHSNSTEISTISICTLPTVVVGEIASCLDQQSYAKFARANRKLFVDCHSPNRLTKLDLSELDDCNEVHFHYYPSIKHLKFRMSRRMSGISISEHCRKIDTLEIARCHRRILITKPPSLHKPYLLSFLRQNISLFSNLTTLSIANCFLNCSIRKGHFLSVLTECEALEHLKLYDVDISDGLETSELQSSWCTVKCLTLEMDFRSSNSVLLSAFSSTLNTLILKPRHSDTTNFIFPSDCDWPKLERLCLVELSLKSMADIVQKAKVLKDICLVPAPEDWNESILQSGIGMIFKTVIWACTSIESIYIDMRMVESRRHFEDICIAIYNGLCLEREKKREHLEIGLHLSAKALIDDEDEFLICKLSQILLVLCRSNTKQWMITLENEYSSDHDKLTESIRKFLGLHPELQVILTRESPARTIIVNKNCKMVGHDHWWNDCHEIAFY